MFSAGIKILVTGSQGFIGRNFVARCREHEGLELLQFDRGDDPSRIASLVAQVDVVVHLAGENRPQDPGAFDEVNAGLTKSVCEAIRMEYVMRGRRVKMILASSIQAERDNPYGRSKLAAEAEVRALALQTSNSCTIFRFPGVFGKWCRPNYNSVVATFCHNIARGLPVRIDDPSAVLRLAYIDEVVDAICDVIASDGEGVATDVVIAEYSLRIDELAEQLQAFYDSRANLCSERVGSGLIRALYATYLTYLPHDRFTYKIPQYADTRGVFVEMLKTKDSGQFSFFTAGPGITRGGHYHHSKSEKFLVIQGDARFRFRHIISDEVVEVTTSGHISEVVETIPGWSHDITNVGSNDMVVMLWANENFDRNRPDTIASVV